MLNVGIGEYAISNDKDEVIVTHALGSCVALIMYCEKTKHTGLAHIVLPDRQSGSKDLSALKPGYFAEDIVPEFIRFFLGNKLCNKEQLKIHIVGGAYSLSKNDVFKVGQRNAEKVVSILTSHRLIPTSIDVGGNISRTVSVNINNGLISVKQQNMII